MERTLHEIAQHIGARLAGPAPSAARVHRVASIASAGADALVFVDDPKHLDAALASSAAAVIAGEFAAASPSPKPLLIARQPKLAFARAARFLADSPRPAPGIHATAVVDPGAMVAPDASIGPGCVIAAGASIGARTILDAHVNIARDVQVGSDCHLSPGVMVYSGSAVGDRVVVHAGAVLGSDGFGYVRDESTGRYEQFPQQGTLQIGDDVEIGANTTIDRGALDATIIGRGTKLDNLVHIGHNVRIGEDVVIAAQTGISGSSVIENGAIIAGQVGIADHVEIGEGVILGAQCGVPSNKIVRGKGELFWGTPARPIRGYLRELAILARLGKKK